MKHKIKIFLLPLIVLLVSCSQQRALWKGGLWNVYNNKNEVTAYGYVKIYIQSSGQVDYPYVLKVQWIENNKKLGERLFASALIPESGPYIIDDNLKFRLSKVPGKVYIKNSKNESIWLSFYNPMRIELYKIVDKP